MKGFISAFMLGFAILLAPTQAQACSCTNSAPFLQAAKRSELVVRGKVVEYRWWQNDPNHERPPAAMIVEIQERYQGRTNSRRVTVWGDNGMQCRPYVSQFPIGTEWILAVSKETAKKGDWAISTCGQYWLKVQGENVIGRVTNDGVSPKPQTISLTNFRKLLQASQ